MTELAIFDFSGQGVRVVVRGGEPWFVASDVARVLGYSDSDQAIRNHCKARDTCPVESTGQVRNVAIIPERDVYRLIMRSRLPSAEQFEELVVGTILPSIRKTGSYGRDPVKVLNDPAALRQLLLENVEKVLALQSEVAEARPKVEVYDRLVETKDTVGFREACKLIKAATGAGENEVRGFMIFARWIQRLNSRLAPASYGQEKGYVTVRDREVPTPDGTMIVPELRVTQRGVVRAIERLNNTGKGAA